PGGFDGGRTNHRRAQGSGRHSECWPPDQRGGGTCGQGHPGWGAQYLSPGGTGEAGSPPGRGRSGKGQLVEDHVGYRHPVFSGPNSQTQVRPAPGCFQKAVETLASGVSFSVAIIILLSQGEVAFS